MFRWVIAPVDFGWPGMICRKSGLQRYKKVGYSWCFGAHAVSLCFKHRPTPSSYKLTSPLLASGVVGPWAISRLLTLCWRLKYFCTVFYIKAHISGILLWLNTAELKHLTDSTRKTFERFAWFCYLYCLCYVYASHCQCTKCCVSYVLFCDEKRRHPLTTSQRPMPAFFNPLTPAVVIRVQKASCARPG